MKNVYLERKKDGRFTFGSLQSQDCVPDFNTQYKKRQFQLNPLFPDHMTNEM